MDIATDLDIVRKAAPGIFFDGERLGQGRENAKQYFKDNPDIARTHRESHP